MKLVPVALYIGDLLGAPSNAKFRRRYRKKGLSSQVGCTLAPKDDAFFAMPIFCPEPRRRARFRLQLRVPLLAGVPDDEFALVIQPVRETPTTDPEQTILAPIYAGPDRLIFEFTRAEVLWCTKAGAAGVRLAVIDPATGQLGTRDRPVTSGPYAALLARCRGQLEGDDLLFPPRQDLRHKASRIPKGTPALQFSTDDPAPICEIGALTTT